VGTEPARLYEQLEAALAPAWVIERALRSGGMSRVSLVNNARPVRRIVAKVPHPNFAGDVSVRRVERALGSRQDLRARCVDRCALGVTSALDAVGVMRLPAKHAADPPAPPRGSFWHSILSRRRGLTWPPRRDRDVDAGLRVSLCALLQPRPVASTLPSTQVRHTGAASQEGVTREVVSPPPTGGRFK
jgi:hypothetical protein